jgi:hypothetical protein
MTGQALKVPLNLKRQNTIAVVFGRIAAASRFAIDSEILAIVSTCGMRTAATIISMKSETRASSGGD